MLNINSIEVTAAKMTMYARKIGDNSFEISVTVDGQARNLTLSTMQIDVLKEFLEKIRMPI